MERFNRSLGEMLAKVIDSNQNTWQDYLTQVQFAYNTAHHESIADIPYRVVFKEIPRTLLQAAADTVCRPTGHTVTSPAIYADRRSAAVPGLYQKVMTNSIQASRARQKQYNRSKLHFTSYHVGDLVWIVRPSGGKQTSRSPSP